MQKLHFQLEHVATPVGAMLVVSDDEERLRALDWEDYEPRMHHLLRLHYGADAVALSPRRSASGPRRALEAYLAGDLRAIDAIAVETRGTDFQRKVWAALRRIPPGETLSYGVMAGRIGRAKAVRAVGAANGANPVSVVVPCHRVVGHDRSLTGYGGGLQRKSWLLKHEGAGIGVS
jgi:methylated-DNA-[protein]-cysteine S-methyltransferase